MTTSSLTRTPAEPRKRALDPDRIRAYAHDDSVPDIGDEQARCILEIFAGVAHQPGSFSCTFLAKVLDASQVDLRAHALGMRLEPDGQDSDGNDVWQLHDDLGRTLTSADGRIAAGLTLLAVQWALEAEEGQ